MRNIFLCAVLSLTGRTVLAADQTVCATSDIYYNSWQANGGPAPHTGMLIAVTHLTLDNKLVETSERHFGWLPPVPKYDIAFDQSTMHVIESSGSVPDSRSVYRIRMTVTSPSTPGFSERSEVVLCQNHIQMVP